MCKVNLFLLNNKIIDKVTVFIAEIQFYLFKTKKSLQKQILHDVHVIPLLTQLINL